MVTWGARELGLSETEVGLEGSATRVWGLRPPPPRRKGEILTAAPQILVDTLWKNWKR